MDGGSEPLTDCPDRVSVSISGHLHFGVAAVYPEHSFFYFVPFLILHFYYEVYLLIHLNFPNGACFISRSVMPVLTRTANLLPEPLNTGYSRKSPAPSADAGSGCLGRGLSIFISHKLPVTLTQLVQGPPLTE